MLVLQRIKAALRGFAYKLSELSRRRKIELFQEVFEARPDKKVLWIGAAFSPRSLLIERLLPLSYDYPEAIVFADIDVDGLVRAKGWFPNSNIVCCDARALPFKDKAIDIVFSNAVIEHVGAWSEQQEFATEVMRVAKGWFVATPNLCFPFEFHYRLPFIHWLPHRLQVFVKKYVGGRYPRGKVANVHLLTPRQMSRLFPGSEIALVRITILPESIVAYRKDEG